MATGHEKRAAGDALTFTSFSLNADFQQNDHMIDHVEFVKL